MGDMLARPLRRRQPCAPADANIADPLLRRVLAHRGHQPGAATGLAALLPWQSLSGIESAVGLLMRARTEGWRIQLVGDFDCDGATGVALGVSGLQLLGYPLPDWVVPDRQRLGYGLTPALADEILQTPPDLVITVDNGISSLAGIAKLRARGVRVIVTDHHLPGADLPQADAIVNPNQPGDAFPSKSLCGVGVLFYLLLALRSHLRERGQLSSPPNLARLLDLVALGTVADVVPLDHNNRLLVEHGLRQIRAGHARPGIQALIEVSGRQAAMLQASDLGFALGPRINAAGRLESMRQGIECLLAPDLASARPLARNLNATNQARREMQDQMQRVAIDTVALNPPLPAAICQQQPDWHEGIVGLVAGQLKERFHRPAVAFAPTAAGQLKGSARSIPGLHIRDALALVAAREPGLISRFGGHAMAAGLSLEATAFEAFEQAFCRVCEEQLDAAALNPVWDSDGPLTPDDMRLQTARALQAGGPWGQGWPEALFDGEFEVSSQRIVGQGHLKLQLTMAGHPGPLDGIAFGVDAPLPPGPVHLVYQLDVNEYRGQQSLQLLVRGQVLSSS